MSAETPRLKFQPIPEGIQVTADTWAEALDRIDVFCDLHLLGQFIDTPPANPADGDAYLTGGAPSGAWTNQAYKIAACRDGQWRFYTPFNGLRAYVAPSGAFIVYLNGQWLDWNSLLSAGETSIASAATCDLGAANALFVQITGTATIASFGSGTNKLRFVRFAQALTLSHNATALILLGNASRTTAAGDVGIYASDAAGNWRERAYFRGGINPGDAATKSGSETLSNKTLSGAALSGTTSLPGGGSLGSSGTLRLGASVGNADFNLGINSNSSLRIQSCRSDHVSDGYYLTFTANYSPYAATIAACGKSLITTDGYEGVTDTYLYSNGAAALHLDSSQNVLPNTDNTKNLGSAPYRWAVIYAGTGTINTSGAAAKINIRGLDAAEMAVAGTLAANVRVFQFCDAVAKKGAEAARLHAGMIYEDVVAAFAAQGLDPLRYGVVCRDPATRTVTESRTVQRPRMQTVAVEKRVIAVKDGVATLTIVPDTAEQPVLQPCPLVDAQGAPVVDPATGRQRIHFEPVMEDGEIAVETRIPDRDENGAQKWTLGLRYGELVQFVIAGLAARLAALEKA
jgi:hypothetical protein